MTDEQKEQLILILRMLSVSACETEENFRYVASLINELSDMFLEGDDYDMRPKE